MATMLSPICRPFIVKAAEVGAFTLLELYLINWLCIVVGVLAVPITAFELVNATKAMLGFVILSFKAGLLSLHALNAPVITNNVPITSDFILFI